jgi:acyl dehydratase
MTVDKRIAYQNLKADYEFPPASFQIDPATVSDYLKAVGEDNVIYKNAGLVPPMAVAALALKSLIDAISMPRGTIHVSQEFDFIAEVNTHDILTSRARVGRVQERGKLHLITVDINVSNQENRPVLAGKTGFILSVS